jgi:sugar O-acyltransferase (sialic acid O-acetyltransferase NeuD family)
MKIYLIGAKNPESARMAANFNCMGYLDSTPEKKGADFYGHKVHGWTEVMEEINDPDVKFLSMVTGTTENRKKSYDAIKECGGEFVTLVHPSVNTVGVKYGEGCWIQENVVLQAEVELGINVSIHIGALVGHETKIGDHSFIAHGASISGCVNIGEGALIGTNATILPRLNIGKWATVGAGAVVTKDVPDYATVVGNPAKIISTFKRI